MLLTDHDAHLVEEGRGDHEVEPAALLPAAQRRHQLGGGQGVLVHLVTVSMYNITLTH